MTEPKFPDDPLEIARCECYGFNAERSYVPCGCGDPDHIINLFRHARAIHWRKGHWALHCVVKVLLQEAKERREKDRSAQECP